MSKLKFYGVLTVLSFVGFSFGYLSPLTRADAKPIVNKFVPNNPIRISAVTPDNGLYWNANGQFIYTGTTVSFLSSAPSTYRVAYPRHSPEQPVHDGIDADDTGAHFYAGGAERLHLDPGGTLHYRGSEVATVYDLNESLKYVATVGDVVRTDALIALVTTTCGMLLSIFIAFGMRWMVLEHKKRVRRERLIAYRAKQPKPDSSPYRGGVA